MPSLNCVSDRGRRACQAPSSLRARARRRCSALKASRGGPTPPNGRKSRRSDLRVGHAHNESPAGHRRAWCPTRRRLCGCLRASRTPSRDAGLGGLIGTPTEVADHARHRRLLRRRRATRASSCTPSVPKATRPHGEWQEPEAPGVRRPSRMNPKYVGKPSRCRPSAAHDCHCRRGAAASANRERPARGRRPPPPAPRRRVGDVVGGERDEIGRERARARRDAHWRRRWLPPSTERRHGGAGRAGASSVDHLGEKGDRLQLRLGAEEELD